MGCVAFCRLRDGNKIGPRISVRLCFLKFVKKLKKCKKNIKILKDVSLFAASGTAPKSDPESPLPCVF